MTDPSSKSNKKPTELEIVDQSSFQFKTEIKNPNKSRKSSENSTSFSPLIVPKKAMLKSPISILPAKTSKSTFSNFQKNSNDGKMDQIKSLYKLKKYQDVKNECLAIIRSDQNNTTILYLLANSFMFMNQFEKAIKV